MIRPLTVMVTATVRLERGAEVDLIRLQGGLQVLLARFSEILIA